MLKLANRYLILFIVLVMLPVLACGGGGGDEDTPVPAATEEAAVPPPAPTDAPEPVPTEAPSLAVASLDQVQSAVVQIVAQGSFVDPEFGLQLNAAGSGTGFIIDPSGIAVTNNHVVTGAAFLQVYIQGEDRPRNAQVLGVSECSDLAVIDIDGPDLPYLEWYQGDVNVGLDVYAAGYPLGDPEFTLTRGIISKARADGETSWASVDNVVEHDATINPGNSGGPLITADGHVVGVNYAGLSSANQYFAIARAEALPVIEALRSGSDVHSVGINGQAVSDGDTFGIWVSSVESGSPADNADIQAGDIIYRLENLVVATDGTMSDYCDILRSRSGTDVMAVEVIRYATEEYLVGQLNGTPLELDFSFAAAINETAGEGSVESSTVIYDYSYVTDDSGLLSLEIPTTWVDVSGESWNDPSGNVMDFGIFAAPSLDGFLGGWSTPGVLFGVSYGLGATTTPNDYLDTYDYSDSCTFAGRLNYPEDLDANDPVYSGVADIWSDCGDEDSLYLLVAAVPTNGAYLVVVGVQIVSDADIDAAQRIWSTFYFDE